MGGKLQKYFKFAALFVASAALSLAPGANSFAAAPPNARAHRSVSHKSSHSSRKTVHAPSRSRATSNARTSRIAAHPSSHTRPGMRLARYSRPQQQSNSTAAAKKKKTRRRRRSRRQSYQKAPTPERISEIQSALARGGYYHADPNGKWDSNTVDALEKFQSANGLEPSGKLDALSLQKMGLGSDIAGVSAPKQLPPAGSVPPASTPRPPATSPSISPSSSHASSPTTMPAPSHATPPAPTPANPSATSSTVAAGSNAAPSAPTSPQHADSSAAPSTSSGSSTSSSPR